MAEYGGNMKVGMYDDKFRMFGMSNSFDAKAMLDAELQMLKLQNMPYENKIKVAEEEIKVWNQFDKYVTSLEKAAKSIKELNVSDREVTMNQTGYVDIKASGNAINASYNVSVQSLATNHKLLSGDMGDETQALGLEGTVQINGLDLKIDTSMSLNKIAENINVGNYNTSAVVLNGQMILTSKETGTAGSLTFLDNTASQTTATSSDTTIASATVTGTPETGTKTYNFDVQQVAQNQIVESNTTTLTGTDPLGYTGDFTIGGQTISLAATDTMDNVVTKINNSASGVTASFASGKLTLTGDVTGSANAFSLADSTTNGTDSLFQNIGVVDATNTFLNTVQVAQDAQYTMDGGAVQTSATNTINDITGVDVSLKSIGVTDVTVTGSTGGILKTLGILDGTDAIKNEIESAQDANYTIDGIGMTSSTNTISDALTGVTLELLRTTATDVRVNISQNNDLIGERVQTFVSEYNKTIGAINQLTAKGAVLQGETAVNSTKMIMSSGLMFQNESELMMFQLGVSIDGTAKDGTITFDKLKLDEQLKTNYDETIKLLSGYGSFSDNFAKKIYKISGVNGKIESEVNGLNKEIQSAEDTLDNKAILYEQKRQSLLEKYARFEIEMSQLQSQMDYMTAQLQSLSSKK